MTKQSPIFDSLVAEFAEEREIQVRRPYKGDLTTPEDLYRAYCAIFGVNHTWNRKTPQIAGGGLLKMKGIRPTVVIVDEWKDDEKTAIAVDEPQVIFPVKAVKAVVQGPKVRLTKTPKTTIPQAHQRAAQSLRELQPAGVRTLFEKDHIGRLANVETQELDVTLLRKMMSHKE